MESRPAVGVDARARGTGGGTRWSTPAKAAFKTTELAVYVLAVVGVLIASAVVDDKPDFGAQEAWQYITWLTIGYLVSRGLAKSGSRDFYDDEPDRDQRI